MFLEEYYPYNVTWKHRCVNSTDAKTYKTACGPANDQMRRLIWVLTGRSCNLVENAVPRLQFILNCEKKVSEKSRECHNHKPQANNHK